MAAFLECTSKLDANNKSENMIDFYYLVFIIILYFLTFSRGNERNRFKWASIITLFFVGFRACVVGADTYNYTLGYLDLNYYKNSDIEILYKNIYIPFLSNIIRYEPFFIFINTLVTLSPLYVLIKKYSNNRELSILCFFIFDLYISYFVALRQILGISFLLWGVYFVVKKNRRKWVYYGFFSLIAFGFHKSMIIPSILYAIVYFLQMPSRNIVVMTILLTGTFGIVLNSFDVLKLFNAFLNLNLGLTTDRLNEYMNDNHLMVGLSSGMIYKLRFVWLGCFVYYFMDERRLNHWFSKLFLISILLYNVFLNVDMIARMNLAFYIFSIVVFPWSFGERFRSIYIRKKWVVIYPVLIFAWFTQAYVRSHIDYNLNNVDRMHPYCFFWEDYNNHPSITRF